MTRSGPDRGDARAGGPDGAPREHCSALKSAPAAAEQMTVNDLRAGDGGHQDATAEACTSRDRKVHASITLPLFFGAMSYPIMTVGIAIQAPALGYDRSAVPIWLYFIGTIAAASLVVVTLLVGALRRLAALSRRRNP